MKFIFKKIILLSFLVFNSFSIGPCNKTLHSDKIILPLDSIKIISAEGPINLCKTKKSIDTPSLIERAAIGATTGGVIAMVASVLTKVPISISTLTITTGVAAISATTAESYEEALFKGAAASAVISPILLLKDNNEATLRSDLANSQREFTASQNRNRHLNEQLTTEQTTAANLRTELDQAQEIVKFYNKNNENMIRIISKPHFASIYREYYPQFLAAQSVLEKDEIMTKIENATLNSIIKNAFILGARTINKGNARYVPPIGEALLVLPDQTLYIRGYNQGFQDGLQERENHPYQKLLLQIIYTGKH